MQQRKLFLYFHSVNSLILRQTVLPDKLGFRTKIGWKCQNSKATFWVIFKLFGHS